MADLSLNNLNKIYPNGVQAVFDFNMEIKDGEFIVLVGPSGCGKTTTLRMVAGLEDISSGEMFIDGINVTTVAPKDRDISMVFQNYALYGHMTVYQNMAFSLTLRGVDKDEIHKKVMNAAKILGLLTQLNKLPKQLSGGQRQRVAVGRAIVRDPKVFLFDEPLSNLDAKLRGQMRRELKLLHQNFNATMIYVTHDQIEALTLADRIVCMNNGRVQQIGTPLELYASPANLFVASFIGLPPMNFFDVEVKNSTAIGDGFSVELSPQQTERLAKYNGKHVVLGIRPEDVELGGSIELTVQNNENMGQYTLIHSQLGKKGVIFKLGGWQGYGFGDAVQISFKQNKLHFFNKETTQAI